ncbi:F-box protein [Aspergillus glaucus CBS 516.65]|uniref:F-box domain-containing protein n=1 Tax=Aspergillus glaucus CBS 516.65 TaxID=1160497 RepID=A0A1L9V9A4_ASPGL|nr:hypothetical protein ASPGLDRAFT_69283 [Aspergillus glaucus CBS 516.65]OJJ80473.1 hypothetical protein ASPGLDRAFT_69283 [Aspergillus glaucus CBS 516.65]
MPLHLYSLPNEVFVQILTPFCTRDVLPLAKVSHRFRALVLRILHYRLLVAASLKEYKLILECFHPASKLTEPHVFCKYLGTDGLSDKHEGEGSLYENVEEAQKLGRLTSLYSRFRPEVTVEERTNGSRLVPFENGLDPDDLTVKRAVHIEDAEDFSQLCVMVNLVKVMPGSNRLLSAVTVKESVAWLFRKWLREQSQRTDPDILWVDQGENVGLRMRVREKRRPGQAAILIHRDEAPVSYDVDIEELHVRTTRVLLTLEQALQEQQNYRQAVVFSLG